MFVNPIPNLQLKIFKVSLRKRFTSWPWKPYPHRVNPIACEIGSKVISKRFSMVSIESKRRSFENCSDNKLTQIIDDY